MTDFYLKFSSYDNKKLFLIVLDPINYRNEAIKTAEAILKERGLGQELSIKVEQRQQEMEVQELLEQEENYQKAEYYKNIVDLKNNGVYFNIRLTDIPRFESELIDQNIDFYREEKHVGPQLDTYPTQTYYFKSNDAEVVDQIVKNIGLITMPYTDIKPYFKFEIVATFVILILIALLVFFLQ